MSADGWNEESKDNNNWNESANAPAAENWNSEPAANNWNNKEPTTAEVINITSEPKVEEDVGFKVFVGNLSFQTTEDELAKFFGSVGKVLKANIITRGTRSLGYGFVAFETSEDAEKATQELDKKELGAREINVEVAKPKEASAAREGGPRSGRRGRGNRGARGSFRGGFFPGAFRGGRGGFRGRGFRGGRGRGFRGRGGKGGAATADGEVNAQENEEGTAQQDQTVTPSPRRFGRRRAPQIEDSEEKVDGEVPNGEGGDEAPPRGNRRGRGGRRGRGRGRGRGGRGRSGSRRRSSTGGRGPAGEGHEAGEPSKTTVFVANLPFATDDEGLKALFKDYNLKSAHVVKRRSGRSKGFGFVDLVDEEEQQKVLDGMKNVVTEGRELVIKIALSEPHVFEDEKQVDTSPVVVEGTN